MEVFHLKIFSRKNKYVFDVQVTYNSRIPAYHLCILAKQENALLNHLGDSCKSLQQSLLNF